MGFVITSPSNEFVGQRPLILTKEELSQRIMNHTAAPIDVFGFKPVVNKFFVARDDSGRLIRYRISHVDGNTVAATPQNVVPFQRLQESARDLRYDMADDIERDL